MREDRPQMDTRTLLRERLRRSRDWTQTIDDLEKETESTGTKPEQSERLFELAALVEDVIPERERALGLYQRAWKLHPDNLKALSRAREVYGEIGRFEMVAKLGEMELRSPQAATNLAQIVGEALVDSGQKDKALPILQRSLGARGHPAQVRSRVGAALEGQRSRRQVLRHGAQDGRHERRVADALDRRGVHAPAPGAGRARRMEAAARPDRRGDGTVAGGRGQAVHRDPGR